MSKREYDAIITNVSDTKFTGYYTKGVNMKLSDGITVINIWKPGRCPYYREEVYKDAIIEISGNSTNRFTYSDMQKLNQAVEYAIDYLNNEKENLIDREKIGTYETVETPKMEKKKTSAIPYKDLQVGGVYLDNKEKKWIFLGKGTLYEDGTQRNRSNGGGNYCEYMYMEYPEEGLESVDFNEFNATFWPHPDTYASKKRFFEKDSQLVVDSSSPIIINCGSRRFEACHNLKVKSRMEIIQESMARGDLMEALNVVVYSMPKNENKVDGKIYNLYLKENEQLDLSRFLDSVEEEDISNYIITGIKNDNEKCTYGVIATFLNPQNNKNYIIYSNNSYDQFNKLRIFSAIYNEDSPELFIGYPSTNEEWALIYHVLDSILLDNN